MSDKRCLSHGMCLHLYQVIMTLRLLNDVANDAVSTQKSGAQWLSGKMLDSRPRDRGFEPHRRHRVVSLSKNINPSLVLVQPRKTRPFIAERLLMGRKESNQTKSTQKSKNTS